MDPTAFSDQASGRLVREGTGEAAFHAFVPNPLPPALEFDVSLANRLAEATRAVGELEGLARSLTNPYLFVRPFIRREAVASSRIEGTQADLDDLYVFEADQGVLPGMETEDDHHDVREVYNYVVALSYALDRLEELPLCLRLIREAHERLLEGVRGEHKTPGEFRRSQNWIGPPGCTLSEATYVPPPVPEMTDALGDLERYLHAGDDPYHPLVRLGFIHYQFEAIHPFGDGNGRIGRLLIALLAVHWGLVSQPLLYVSPFFVRHRDAYYDLLMAVTTRGSWRAWMEFFLKAVTDQADDAVARARGLLDLHSRWHAQLTKQRSTSPMALADALFETPVLSIPQAQEILGMTYHAARRSVQKLVDYGILTQLGEGSYGRLYVAEDIMRLLTTPGVDR